MVLCLWLLEFASHHFKLFFVAWLTQKIVFILSKITSWRNHATDTQQQIPFKQSDILEKEWQKYRERSKWQLYSPHILHVYLIIYSFNHNLIIFYNKHTTMYGTHFLKRGTNLSVQCANRFSE